MKNKFKLGFIFILTIITGLVLIACDNSDDTLDKALTNLTVETILGDNESKDAITKDLVLPTKDGEVVITWDSNKPAVITAEGEVTRQDADETVRLTATLSYDGAEEDKHFDLVVLKADGEVDPDEEFTVIFNSDGGTSVASQAVEEGNKVTQPEDPTKAGFKFLGWFLGEVEFNFDTAITADITLVAKWEENAGELGETITVVAKYPGGATINMVEGSNNAEALGLDPSIFNVTSDAIGQYNNIIGLNTNGSIRLYSNRADGEGNTLEISTLGGQIITSIEITYLAGNNTVEGETSGLITFGNAEGIVLQLADIQNTTKEYTGLNVESFTIKNTTTGSKNGQIWISEIQITYVGGEDIEPVVKHEVSFNSDGGSVVESQTINEGSKANRPVDPTKEGFDFLGWFIGENEFDFDTLITEAITLTAHWEEAEPEEPGDEVEVTTEYIFTSNTWGTSQNDWTSGKGGNQYQSGSGIQVTSGASGANGTTKITFYNVKSIEITYSTNASKGAGTIVTKVGNETVQTFTVSTSGGTTNRSAGVINVDSLDGAITITVNCTKNSIYLYGIKIVHTES